MTAHRILAACCAALLGSSVAAAALHTPAPTVVRVGSLDAELGLDPPPVLPETARAGAGPTSTTHTVVSSVAEAAPPTTSAPRPHARPLRASTPAVDELTSPSTSTSVAPAVVAERASRRCEAAAQPAVIDGPITASGSFAADGDSVTRIAASVDPGAWSIDRSRFAFQVADDSGRVEVCVLAVGARRVTGGAVELAAGALYAPGAVQLWSADNALVMNHWTTAVDLVSLDPTDGNRRKLADGGMFDISADGRSLATIVGDREHPVVSIVDLHAGTSRAVPVTARELMPTAPRWLTHHRLAFHARGLVVIDLETRAETTLFVEQANATIGNFAFSRAGDNVAWSVTGPSPSPDHGLHIRDPSGLVANTGILADPLAWNTDGTLLLATSCDDRSCSLQVIDVGDKTTRPIAQTSSNELRFTSRSGWVADGSIEFGVMSFPRAR